MADEEEHTYTCEGCGRTFTGKEEDAFQAGWDTPERFMSHCTCEYCPINKTIWWKVAVLKQTEITPDEVRLLLSYQEIWRARAHPEYKAIMEGRDPDEAEPEVETPP